MQTNDHGLLCVLLCFDFAKFKVSGRLGKDTRNT